MAVRKFLQWAPTASPSELAEAAGALARAFLYGDLPEPEREEARLTLTGLLDDSLPLVRLALAESFASAANVPHYMVLTLANDSSDVAAIVLARSPLLSDAELVECTATADAFAQSAIALRPWVSTQVAAALAEVGARKALITLAVNPGAELLEFSIRRMIERYGHDPELRAALLARPNLSASLRSDLAGAAAKALSAMMTGRAALTPERARCLTREARERANVKIAAETAGEANKTLNFVAHLRRSSQLTAGLLLRGAFAACFYRGFGGGRKSGCGGPMNARLQGPIVDSVLHACASVNHGELDRLIAALRRLEAEVARDEAREFRLARGASHAIPALASARRLPPAARIQTSPAETIVPERRGTPENAEGFSIDLAAFAEELAAA
jgi:uncharacterized protein (DUF2336 family)